MPNIFKTSSYLKAAQERIALPVAGDNAAAKAIVLRSVDRVDAGRLDESWRQQSGAPVYAADFDADGVQRALAKSSRERAPEWCATPRSPSSFAAPA
jgi:predicted dinucleotide-binding enzyme